MKGIILLLAVVMGVLGMGQVSFAATQSSVSQFGVTWTFDKAYEVGQFANGDWWVVGPVNINSISPASTTVSGVTKNGSMLGPATVPSWGDQALDSRMANLTWRPELNIAAQLPYTVPINKSVISSISCPTVRDTGRCQLDYEAVLTVLPSAPPAGSFRPSYLGADKAIRYNKSQIDYSKLRSLAPVANTPTLASVEGMFPGPFIMLGASYCGIFYPTAYYNCPVGTYGREITQATSYAALSLNLNYTNAQKELLAIRFIQYGLDIYGGVKAGLVFDGNGGHANGRKIPMLMAGLLLNDADIIERCNGITHVTTFSEDQTHFYVSQHDIDLPRGNIEGRQIDPYPQSALGMPEWGASEYYSPQFSGYNWGIYYRDVACPNLTGAALACHLMGIEALWNRPAFFDYYTTRWVPKEHDGGKINLFMLHMWDAYRTGTPPGPVAAAGADRAVHDADHNGSELVTLDGSGSYSSGGAITSWTWSENGLGIATGSQPTVPLALGVHTITLTVVNNGTPPASATDTIILTVSSTPTVVSSTLWQNFSLGQPGQSFTVEFDAQPNGGTIDGLFGLNNGAADGYSDLACTFRFYTNGRMDVRNGASYTADVTATYVNGTWYHLRMVVDVAAHRYSVYVQPLGGAEFTLASNYAFRTEQSAVAALDQWSIVNVGAPTMTVKGVALAVPGEPLTVTGWTAVADHGALGELAIAAGENYLESREAGLARLRLTFSAALNPATVNNAAVSLVGQTSGNQAARVAGVTLSGGNTVIVVQLSSPLPDADRYTLTLADTVKGADGKLVDGSSRVRHLAALAGDVDGSGVVGAGDVVALRNQAGAAVTAATARYDLNGSGTITGADMQEAESRKGHRLP